ncbi:hypothetical protein M011DRAFT_489963 [Sporormia fimetaria CBS 119925]|uniref:Uncharacterized protein n=1 Tax=Sporormia fimetaria CBS 119925 TaxID=1340428 RepID=A0A6A6UZP9_9PLEO|nr:hypothetical protein M011DRAFT_489963 [Sporormia fimetaria CBS 119925]
MNHQVQQNRPFFEHLHKDARDTIYDFIPTESLPPFTLNSEYAGFALSCKTAKKELEKVACSRFIKRMQGARIEHPWDSQLIRLMDILLVRERRELIQSLGDSLNSEAAVFRRLFEDLVHPTRQIISLDIQPLRPFALNHLQNVLFSFPSDPWAIYGGQTKRIGPPEKLTNLMVNLHLLVADRVTFFFCRSHKQRQRSIPITRYVFPGGGQLDKDAFDICLESLVKHIMETNKQTDSSRPKVLSRRIALAWDHRRPSTKDPAALFNIPVDLKGAYNTYNLETSFAPVRDRLSDRVSPKQRHWPVRYRIRSPDSSCGEYGIMHSQRGWNVGPDQDLKQLFQSKQEILCSATEFAGQIVHGGPRLGWLQYPPFFADS